MRVLFRGLRELNVIHEPLEDGAEIMYTEDIGVPEERLREWGRPRERLGVFRLIVPRAGGQNCLPAVFGPLVEASESEVASESPDAAPGTSLEGK